jgi:hypothetical protein
MVAAIELVILMSLSIFNLIMDKHAKRRAMTIWYPYALMGGFFAFCEGCIFAYFTYTMATE